MMVLLLTRALKPLKTFPPSYCGGYYRRTETTKRDRNVWTGSTLTRRSSHEAGQVFGYWAWGCLSSFAVHRCELFLYVAANQIEEGETSMVHMGVFGD